MSESVEQFDVMFYQLILSLQQTAMVHLGKVMSPLSGKIDRNLPAAKQNIDLLETIQRKTKGNLTADEQKLLDHMLFELRMNYVEESAKPDEPEEGSEDKSESQGDPGKQEAAEGGSDDAAGGHRTTPNRPNEAGKKTCGSRTAWGV